MAWLIHAVGKGAGLALPHTPCRPTPPIANPPSKFAERLETYHSMGLSRDLPNHAP